MEQVETIPVLQKDITICQSVVGEEAILVYPNGLANEAGLTQWNHEIDLVFFDDLFKELEANLCFDRSRVFAVGHSAGAGFVHTLGCKRGNILRAIAPVAGSLLEHKDCIGQVAVMQIQGTNDTYVPLGMIKPSSRLLDSNQQLYRRTKHRGRGIDPLCTAYGNCDPQFPVQYCEHTGGHEWPDFCKYCHVDDSLTAFPLPHPQTKPAMEMLTISAKAQSVSVYFIPLNFVGTPSKMALALYPYDTTPPISTAPSYLLNVDVPLGNYHIRQSD